MQQTKFKLSSFVHTDELSDCMTIYNDKLSTTLILDKNYIWVINLLKNESLTLKDLFNSKDKNKVTMDELSFVVEQYLDSNIVVTTS